MEMHPAEKETFIKEMVMVEEEGMKIVLGKGKQEDDGETVATQLFCVCFKHITTHVHQYFAKCGLPKQKNKHTPTLDI